MLAATKGKDGNDKIKGVPSSGMLLGTMMQVIVPVLYRYSVSSISLTYCCLSGAACPPTASQQWQGSLDHLRLPFRTTCLMPKKCHTLKILLRGKSSAATRHKARGSVSPYVIRSLWVIFDLNFIRSPSSSCSYTFQQVGDFLAQ